MHIYFTLLYFPVTGADCLWHLRFANRQYLATGSTRITAVGPHSMELSWISSGTRTSVQTALVVCLKRTCSLDTLVHSAR